MRPDDLAHLVTPSDPRWHPDGLRLAVVVTRVDLERDRYVRAIHLHDGRRLRPLTAGPGDVHPRWSPDGRTLAFLRTPEGDDATAQLALLPADGGEARTVASFDRGARSFAWSPDGERIVVVADTWIADLADLAPEERRRRHRRITRLPYRVDGEGWVHERRRQLHLVDHLEDDGPTVRALTDLPDDVSDPAWASDDRFVHAITRARDLPDTEPHEQLVSVSVPPPDPATDWHPAGGDAVRWGATGSWAALQVDTRGGLLATGMADPFAWPGVHRVYAVPTDPGGAVVDGPLRDLTGHLDRDVLPGGAPFGPPGPRPVTDGFVTALEDRGTTRLVRVTFDGGRAPEVEDLVGGPRAITAVDVHPDGRTLAVCWTDPTTPGELAVVRDGVEETLTGFGGAFRTEVELAPTERWIFDRDGAELDVWSVLPVGLGDAPPRSIPVLVNIHGGPTAQYGDHFFDEFQVGAGAGYLVVGMNPRGSSGRGTDWARAVVGAWSEPMPVDLADLAALADAVLERYPVADPARIGVMGGSYGGYATARLLATGDRYASAIVERGLLAWGSFGGTSDIGPYFDRMFLGAALADDSGPHRAASPVWTADRVTTPTLVLHSDADWRCPVEQAERYFTALRTAGVTSEFVRFPDEGHELSRSGTPKHRRERFEVVLDWHGRFLR